jgi:hypothetical protein
MFLGIEVKKKILYRESWWDIGIEGKEPLLISSWNFQTLYTQRYLFEYSKLVVFFFCYNIHYCWQAVLECSMH